MKKIKTILALLALLPFSGAFAQEWEYTIEWLEDESPWMKEAKPLRNKNIAVSHFTVFPFSRLDSYQPGLLLLSPDGEELANNGFTKPAFWGYYPHVLSDEDGTAYMMVAYNPDHDSTCANYFLNFDNPPDYSILGLYKLDEQLSIVESHEFHIPVDTSDAHFTGSTMFGPFNSYCGGIHVFSVFIDGSSVVGGYIKKPSLDYFNPHGNDSIFFFRIGLDGTLISHVGYEIDAMGEPGGVVDWSMALSGYHIVKVGDSNIMCFLNGYCINGYDREKEMGQNSNPGYAYRLNGEFDIVDMKLYHQRNGLVYNYFSNAAYVGGCHNTVYLSSDYAKNTYGGIGCSLYEYGLDDDKADDMPILRYIERKSSNLYDCSAQLKGVGVASDNSIYFAYALKDGMDGLTIEHLTPDFDAISTMFYDVDINAEANIIQCVEVTETDDILLTFTSYGNNTQRWWTTVTKFPAEAFVGIKEAHDNGLKVAVAYPNPGKDELNIRTSLKNAHVEIFDMSGKLVHSQAITGSVTSIKAETWPNGVYVWKVVSDGKEAESGKWVKE